jgi:hypothetical protein
MLNIFLLSVILKLNNEIRKITKDGQTKGQKDRQTDAQTDEHTEAQTNYCMSEKSKVINFNLKTMKEFFCLLLDLKCDQSFVCLFVFEGAI